MGAVRAGNLGLRFLLELAMLAALCAWGFVVGPNPVARVGLGLGAPVLAAVLWGALLSPRAPVALPRSARISLELVLFAAATAALVAAGRPGLAVAFALLVVLNEILLAAFAQRAEEA